jgi:hypothetical protein
VFAAAGAAVVGYVAWLTYEDDDRRIQSTLEDWWIQIDDLRSTAVSATLAFVKVVAEKSDASLSWILRQYVLCACSGERVTDVFRYSLPIVTCH